MDRRLRIVMATATEWAAKPSWRAPLEIAVATSRTKLPAACCENFLYWYQDGERSRIRHYIDKLSGQARHLRVPRIPLEW